MKKKLLITASTFPRWEGDTEPRFILDYAKAMLKYYDVTVLAPMDPAAKKQEVLEGVNVIRYSYFPIKKLQTLCYPGAIVPRIKQKKVRGLLVPFMFLSLFLKLCIIGKRYDRAHAHWLIPQGIIHGFTKTPYIVTGHGGDVTSLNKGIFLKLKNRCIRKANAVVTVSEALKEKAIAIDPMCRPYVISMGCDTKLFSPEHRVDQYFDQYFEQDSNQNAVLNGKKVVLFAGRLAEKKGCTYLIEAMKQVENAILVIVGKGPLEAELKEQAAQMLDKVKFLGPKTHQELAAIYASADLFVAPSVTARDGDKEGFGLVIIEAMASGVPVVATRSGGIPDIITDDQNGLLVEEKDVDGLAHSINRVLTDAELCKRLQKESIVTAAKYDYEIIAEQYKNVIEETI